MDEFQVLTLKYQIIGLVLTFITSILTLVVLVISFRLSKAVQKSNIWQIFNKRFEEILVLREEIEKLFIANTQSNTPSNTQSNTPLDTKYNLYVGRFWSLQFDQYGQWMDGFVSDEVFAYWMACRWQEHKLNEKFCNKTFIENWEDWSSKAQRANPFVEYMRNIFAITDGNELKNRIPLRMKEHKREHRSHYQRLTS